jgi:ferredoxin-NADP reductase
LPFGDCVAAAAGGTLFFMRVQKFESEVLVAKRKDVADGVVTLVLESHEGTDLRARTPGAHIDVLMDDGLVRQYSLCSSGTDTSSWRIGVLLDPSSRGGSEYVHRKLHDGTRVRVRRPRNHFVLEPAARYQFIAGGIGITPILTMIEAAEAEGAEWQLLYGGRQRSSMAFLPELARYGDRVTVWRRAGAARPRFAARRTAAGDADLLLRPGPAARRGRNGMRGLAARQPARRALQRQGVRRTRRRCP